METLNDVPVAGTLWESVRLGWDGQPITLKVTSVRPYKGEMYVYSRRMPHGDLGKVRLSRWQEKAKVLSIPEPEKRETEPRLTATQKAALWRRAHEAGMAAGEAARPTPMIVVQRANPFDDRSPITKIYEPVMDGPCGFAYINVRPANGSFGRWMAKTGKGYKGYYGGRQVSVAPFGQSMERKMAYAAAFVTVLRAAGINASSESRMD